MVFVKHVFLSYSHVDVTSMIKLCEMLEKTGLSVWTDEGIEPGTEFWKNAIEEAIEHSSALVVILSPSAKQSIWVKRELDYARAQGVQIFPVLCSGDERTAIPFILIGSQYIDLRADYSGNVDKLITTLFKHIKTRFALFVQQVQSQDSELYQFEIDQIMSRNSKTHLLLERLQVVGNYQVQIANVEQAEMELSVIQRRMEQVTEMRAMVEKYKTLTQNNSVQFAQFDYDPMQILSFFKDSEVAKIVKLTYELREHILYHLENLKDKESSAYETAIGMLNNLIDQIKEGITTLEQYIQDNAQKDEI